MSFVYGWLMCLKLSLFEFGCSVNRCPSAVILRRCSSSVLGINAKPGLLCELPLMGVFIMAVWCASSRIRMSPISCCPVANVYVCFCMRVPILQILHPPSSTSCLMESIPCDCSAVLRTVYCVPFLCVMHFHNELPYVVHEQTFVHCVFSGNL